MKNKVRLSENEPKNHKNGIFSKIAQQIWPKIEIWTHTYVWMLYPKRGKRHFRKSRLSLSNGVNDEADDEGGFHSGAQIMFLRPNTNTNVK